MDERRDQSPAGGSRPSPVAATTRLAPPQEAYGAYTRHALDCDRCQDIDRGRCGEGEDLWHDYHAISGEAFRRLAGGTG